MAKQALCLIAKKEVRFKDGETKIKHLFVNEKGDVYRGWTLPGEELDDTELVSTGAFDSARARELEVDIDEYEGKMRYRVRM